MNQSIFNYCPNCKSEDFSFENNYKMECNACQFVVYHNVAAAVAVIITHQNKVLFTIRNQQPDKGKLDLPGGFIDPNETAEFAACRELKEELGLSIQATDLKYLTSQPNNYLYKNIPYKTLDVFYTFSVTENSINITAKDEIKDLVWLSKSEIDISKIGFVSVRKVIEELEF